MQCTLLNTLSKTKEIVQFTLLTTLSKRSSNSCLRSRSTIGPRSAVRAASTVGSGTSFGPDMEGGMRGDGCRGELSGMLVVVERPYPPCPPLKDNLLPLSLEEVEG